MPELPEVETVRGGLLRLLGNDAQIRKAQLRRRDLRQPIPQAFDRNIANQPIITIERRAKYLLWHLPRVTIINHLGMTGSWRVREANDERKHDHVILHLADGRDLVYHDPRRFGIIDIATNDSVFQHPLLTALGPEPLNEQDFTVDYLAAACARRSAAIKAVIMDGKVVVGVGNIYAAESLFRAGIRPHTPAKKISRVRLERLVIAIRQVLAEAITAGGSTIRDFRQAGGSSGYFQTTFAVYGREDQPCRKCGTILKHMVLAQRATVWCPNCQR